jgi:hypothetical protein
MTKSELIAYRNLKLKKELNMLRNITDNVLSAKITEQTREVKDTNKLPFKVVLEELNKEELEIFLSYVGVSTTCDSFISNNMEVL